jgi:sulfate transport system ATP-binding protein
VYGFLRTVNLFHGRAHDGQLHVGATVLDVPEHGDAHNAPAPAFARPHELDIERYSPGADGILVRLARVWRLGRSVRLELEREDGAQLIETEITAERFRALRLRQSELLVVRPNRLKAFVASNTRAAAIAEIR